MRKFLVCLAISIFIFSGAASACPSKTVASAPILAPLPRFSSAYYCAASSAPQSIGDLSYAGWAKHVQICTSMCSYAPLIPNDPNSPLIETTCGPGYHDQAYYVEPPQPPAGYVAVQFKSPSCNRLVPPKGSAAPSPVPAAMKVGNL